MITENMKTEDFYSNLCYYDLRNPRGIKEILNIYLPDEEDGDLGEHAKEDCSCDNCFYGRTKLAEHIIDLREIIKYIIHLTPITK